MRHPRDCYITPPCAAYALRSLLIAHAWPTTQLEPRAAYLDPFAGPGTLLEWGAPGAGQKIGLEVDERWRPELTGRSDACAFVDSLAADWPRAHVITNPPYAATQAAVDRAVEHAERFGVLVALLLRTDWFQHPGRPAPDALALLRWRPRFSGAVDARGVMQLGSDYAGYAWAIWGIRGARRFGCAPMPALAWLERPPVSEADKATHLRLATQAYHAATRDA